MQSVADAREAANAAAHFSWMKNEVRIYFAEIEKGASLSCAATLRDSSWLPPWAPVGASVGNERRPVILSIGSLAGRVSGESFQRERKQSAAQEGNLQLSELKIELHFSAGGLRKRARAIIKSERICSTPLGSSGLRARASSPGRLAAGARKSRARARSPRLCCSEPAER